MNNENSLIYNFSVNSADTHAENAINGLMESSPNPLSFKCDLISTPYSGRFAARNCGTLGICEYFFNSPKGSNNLFTGNRTRKHIARNNIYEFYIGIDLGGTQILETGGKTYKPQTGDFMITDSETPYTTSTLEQGHACNISFPASWDRIGDIKTETILGKPYYGGNTNKILSEYIQLLLAQSNALELPKASAKLYDVLAIALNPRAVSEHQTGLLALIHNYIDAQLTNPELNPQQVAIKFGISIRHLHRLFSSQEQSFTEYVTTRRLALANKLLTEQRNQSKTILNIALDCGFKDINHFGRRYREQYGVTPRETRRILITSINRN